MAIVEIKKYDVAYYAGAKNAAGYPYRAIIGLRDEHDGLIGAAYFHRDATTLPPSDTSKSSGYISCHYLAQDYPKILDLLRNESPVYVEFEAHSGIWPTSGPARNQSVKANRTSRRVVRSKQPRVELDTEWNQIRR